MTGMGGSSMVCHVLVSYAIFGKVDIYNVIKEELMLTCIAYRVLDCGCCKKRMGLY